MNDGVTRRRLLATGAAAGAVGLAGCLGGRDGEVPEPIVTSDRFDDGWRRIDASASTVFEEAFGPVTVRALERSIVYEYVDVAEAVAETFDAEGSPVLFFASRIDLRPPLDGLPFGVGRNRIMAEVTAAAEGAFRQQLRESGLESVELRERRTIEVAGGFEATEFVFGASFPVAGEIELPVGGTEEASGTVEMEARLAVWHDGTDVMISGGAYPTQRFTDVIDDALPDGAPDATEIVDDDALAADPETFAEEVEALIVAVE